MSWKLEAGGWKLEAGGWKLVAGDYSDQAHVALADVRARRGRDAAARLGHPDPDSRAGHVPDRSVLRADRADVFADVSLGADAPVSRSRAVAGRRAGRVRCADRRGDRPP